jgi:acetyl esterase/lipase
MPDFDAAEHIRRLEASGPPVDPRTGLDTASLVDADPALARVEVTELDVAGPHGPVPVRVYVDPTQQSHDALVWVHGGAFIGGSLDMPEAHWVSLVIASRGIPVISVEYRKALHGVHYPIPSDDVHAAWLWATGADRPVRADRLHFGGASAGANLATGVTQRLRDEGRPGPASLLLAYPLLHSVLPPLSDSLQTALSDNPPPINFTPDVVAAFNANYVGPDLKSATYAFPADGDVHGLPPTLVINAEADEMRASGEPFAVDLGAAGVEVEMRTRWGAQHGFLDVPGDASAIATIDDFVGHIEGTTRR